MPTSWPDFVARRRALLDEGNRLLDRPRPDARPDDFDVEYAALLPEIAVSRCPHSGQVVTWPIDVVDLDGWFWDYDNPIRRTPALPRTWLAMSGALRLNGPVARARFLCRPGPAAPYVVPRILRADGVLAVVSQIEVGPHIGWPITYFGPKPPGVKLENTWGACEYDVFDDDGSWLGWNAKTPWPAEYDFDLEPWLRSGKLFWIAPADRAGTLREGVRGCPYLGIDGPREAALIRDGVVRYPEPKPAIGPQSPPEGEVDQGLRALFNSAADGSRRGRQAEAAAGYEQVLRGISTGATVTPRFVATTILRLACCRMDLGRPDTAVTLLRQFNPYEMCDEPELYEYHFALGNALALLGQLGSMVAEMADAIGVAEVFFDADPNRITRCWAAVFARGAEAGAWGFVDAQTTEAIGYARATGNRELEQLSVSMGRAARENLAAGN
jgi:hypothetical protein